MIRFTNYILTVTALATIFSCGDERTKNQTDETQEIPGALKDVKPESRGISYSGDLAEELYQELVDNSVDLKKLEEDIETLKAKTSEPNVKFNEYNNKSDIYYTSTSNKATAITDSLLRKGIVDLISKSKNNYLNRTSEFNSLINLIQQNAVTIKDEHLALKIILTLPIIEKFQHENLPGKQEFNILLDEQEKVIKRLDSLVRK